MKQKEKTALRQMVPELRFPEFQAAGVWEEKKLGEITDSFSGGTPNTSENRYYGGTIPFIRSAEIDEIKTELFLTQDGLKNSSAKMVNEGDVLVALYGANSGDVAVSKINGAINQAILCLRHRGNNPFIYFYLTFKKNWILSKFIQGGQGNLSGEIIKSIPILIPSLPEQQKIADCLSSLDEVISLESQKLQSLQSYKKGLLQNLFPAEGDTVPKWRFPEFVGTGDWVERKLGDVLIEVPRPIEMEDEQLYSLVIVKRRYEGIISRGDLLGKEIKVKTQFVIKENDFLISKRQIVHNACAIVKKEFESSIVSNEYSVLRAREEISIDFLEYFVKQPSVSKSFMDCSVGIVIEKMLFKLNRWFKEEFLFPSFAEQQKIASCLSTVDVLIQEQTARVEVLKSHKKGLLQGLFPVMEE